jgi:rhomboid protease GluP
MPGVAARYIAMADLDDRQLLMLAAPAAATPSQEASQAAPAVTGVVRFPPLTLALLGLLVAVFAAEFAFGVEPTKGLLEPGMRTLLALGGLQYKAAVGSEEWYRMFLAPLMHAGPVHLLLNGVALYLAGRVLEPMIGARWFAALFVVSGLAGAFASLVVNDPNVISVGASGAIMGLFAAIWVLAHRFADPARTRLRIAAIQVLIPSMLPFASASLVRVDYGAHLGGAIAGAAAAVLLLALWPQGATEDATGNAAKAAARPRLAFVATMIAALGVAGAVYGATQVPHDHKLQSYAMLLFPQDRLPSTEAAAKSAADGIVSRHPRDPRGHFSRALALIDAKNLPAAERELRTALADGELLKAMFKPAFSRRLETLLALVQFDQHKTVEARATAQPLCALGNSTFRDQVAKYGLCSL